jgi:hypothetical protein
MIDPIGGINDFIGNIGNKETDLTSRPARTTAFELDTFSEDRYGRNPSECFRLRSGKFKARPNRPRVGDDGGRATQVYLAQQYVRLCHRTR